MADVHVSKRYQVPADRMWERIGDPLRLAEWHPAIESTQPLDGGKGRVNSLVGGGEVRETILDRDDRSHSWRIDESPLPVENLTATLRVRGEGENACVVEADCTFESVGVSDDEAIALNRGFFQAGLDALAEN